MTPQMPSVARTGTGYGWMCATFRCGSKGWIIILALLAGAASLWLRAGYLPLGVWGGHDDALFLRLARNVGQAQWLGPYDQMTLAKGAFFPLFLLLGKASGLPLKLVEHLLYVLLAVLAATTVFRVSGQRWL